jgi:hypothetical protein
VAAPRRRRARAPRPLGIATGARFGEAEGIDAGALGSDLLRPSGGTDAGEFGAGLGELRLGLGDGGVLLRDVAELGDELAASTRSPSATSSGRGGSRPCRPAG